MCPEFFSQDRPQLLHAHDFSHLHTLNPRIRKTPYATIDVEGGAQEVPIRGHAKLVRVSETTLGHFTRRIGFYDTLIAQDLRRLNIPGTG